MALDKILINMIISDKPMDMMIEHFTKDELGKQLKKISLFKKGSYKANMIIVKAGYRYKEYLELYFPIEEYPELWI